MYSHENIASISTSLMVAPGGGLAVLLSLLGTAMDHPAVFDFIGIPTLLMSIGFLAALHAFHVAKFDPPPKELGRWGIGYLAALNSVSGVCLLLSVALSIPRYMGLMAQATSTLS